MELAQLLCFLAMGTHLVLGTLVFIRSPRNPVNILFSLQLSLFIVWSLGELLIINGGPTPLAVKILFTPVVLLPYVLCWFAALFPRRVDDALILAPGWKRLAIAAPALGLLGLLWADLLVKVAEPVSVGFLVNFGRFEFLAKGEVVGYLLLALQTLSKAKGLLDSDFQQLRLRYTFAALILPASAGSLFVALGRWYLAGQSVYTMGIFPALGILMAILLSYAILRFKLIEIDLIFSIGVVYSLMTMILAGGMELLQNAAQSVLDLTGTWATVLSTLFVAAAFAPLKRLIDRFVDWIFGKRAFDVAGVIRHVLSEMRRGTSATDVLERLLRELQPVLTFSGAVVMMASGARAAREVPVAGDGPIPRTWLPMEELDAIIEAGKEIPGFPVGEFQTWRDQDFRLGFPIRRGEQCEGVLFLRPKVGRLPYATEEKALVSSLCQEVPIVLESLSLMQALVEKDRATREVDQARQMYERIQADASRTEWRGFEIRLFSSLAKEIKGDLIDLEEAGPQPFVALCDAFHQGIQAALTLHILFTAFRSPGGIGGFPLAHRVLSHFSQPPLCSAVTFLVSGGEGGLRLTNAGNPAPFQCSPTRGIQRLGQAGVPLGMDGALPAASVEPDLRPGEFLLCATNGLTKAFGDPDGTALEGFLAHHAATGVGGCHLALQERLARLPDRSAFPDDITYILIQKGKTP